MDAGTRILGALIAGGQSRRFGSDKALAVIDGRPLIDHAVEALRQQTAEVVLCGRESAGLLTLVDRPPGGLGPLAGLNAALHHAACHGFDVVLSVPVDVVPLPDRLPALLGETSGPAVFGIQHLIGWWPVALAPLLEAYLAEGHRSLNGWIDRSGARRIDEPPGMININYREDMDGLRD